MKKKRYFSRTVIVLLAILFAFLFVMPTLLTITNSFMTQSEITANYGQVFSSTTTGSSYISKTINLKFIPDKVSFSQYWTVLLKSPDYIYKLWNSIILTVPIVFAQLMVASIAAYGFTRWRGKVRDSIFFFYVILMLMPYQVTLVPNYLVSDWLGLLNTRWAIILPGAFSTFPVFIMAKGFDAVPIALLEAASIDGAGPLRTFFHIGVPLGVPGILSAAVLGFLEAWNAIEQPMTFLKTKALWPLSLYLPQIAAEKLGLAMVASLVMLAPAVLIFRFGQKYLELGIQASGLKE